jgi:hypothetical protein
MASSIKVDNGVLRNLVKYERPEHDVTVAGTTVVRYVPQPFDSPLHNPLSHK